MPDNKIEDVNVDELANLLLNKELGEVTQQEVENAVFFIKTI